MAIHLHDDTVGLLIKNSNDYTSILDAIDHGLYVCMLDKQLARSGTLTPWADDDIRDIKNMLFRYPMYVYVSCTRLNLCGSQYSLFWSGNTSVDAHISKVLEDFRLECRKANGIDCRFIVEAGKHPDFERGVSAVIKTFDNMVLREGDTILIQNSVGKNALGADLKTIYTIYNAISDYNKEKFGFCIQLAYLYATGAYDFRKQGVVDSFFDYIDQLPKVYAFVLTDTLTAFGSNSFEHAQLGCGTIWNSIETLERILHGCKQRSIHVIVHSVAELRLVRDLNK